MALIKERQLDLGLGQGVTIAEYVEGKVALPEITQTATFTSNDNRIVSLGIVSKLQLSHSCVIRFTGTASLNDQVIHTVDQIIDDDTIIVNYEHCGDRGNGPLKVKAETAEVRIQRLSQNFSAPVGLGQTWLDISAFRLPNVLYTKHWDDVRMSCVFVKVVENLTPGTNNITADSVPFLEVNQGVSPLKTHTKSFSYNRTFIMNLQEGTSYQVWQLC